MVFTRSQSQNQFHSRTVSFIHSFLSFFLSFVYLSIAKNAQRRKGEEEGGEGEGEGEGEEVHAKQFEVRNRLSSSIPINVIQLFLFSNLSQIGERCSVKNGKNWENGIVLSFNTANFAKVQLDESSSDGKPRQAVWKEFLRKIS